jgi:Uncharacterized conserved protein (COG2071).
MRFPALQGVIRRRILVNFRVKPEVLVSILPPQFRPKLYEGWAMVGICLIRLEQIRPKWMPVPVGVDSENAAHRIAVCWTENGEEREGVYIPRRDTNNLLNHLVGGRLFPGEHHHSKFDVTDDRKRIDFLAEANDDELKIELHAHAADELPSSSIFKTLEEASNFFKYGSVGYSETAAKKHLDGMMLITKHWEVKPLAVDSVKSTFFENKELFPEGTIEFDCALIMRDIQHEWQAAPDMETCAPGCSPVQTQQSTA